jgi:uncharacterized membrane protein
VVLLAFVLPPVAFAQAPAVRAILFYSPNCGHCQYVIEEVLPPLFATYGVQLQIIGINVSEAEGSALYAAAMEAMAVPEDHRGVPMLFVGDRVLVGSVEIPEVFPGLIEEGLAHGGIDWPAIPALTEILPGAEPTAQSLDTTPENPEPVTESIEVARHEPLTVGERLQQDPVGNALSIAVLIGMILSLAAVAARWAVRLPVHEGSSASWLVPVLALVGMAVAIYLTIIELSGDPAVCGPVGDCNAVQHSPYAFLFGAIPIGAIGVVGYAVIILAWASTRLLPGKAQDLMRIGLFAMALIGTSFSVYLTFLEPFVIGATCAWCLTSAILQTLVLWLTADPARATFSRWRRPAAARSPTRKRV